MGNKGGKSKQKENLDERDKPETKEKLAEKKKPEAVDKKKTKNDGKVDKPYEKSKLSMKGNSIKGKVKGLKSGGKESVSCRKPTKGKDKGDEMNGLVPFVYSLEITSAGDEEKIHEKLSHAMLYAAASDACQSGRRNMLNNKNQEVSAVMDENDVFSDKKVGTRRLDVLELQLQPDPSLRECVPIMSSENKCLLYLGEMNVTITDEGLRNKNLEEARENIISTLKFYANYSIFESTDPNLVRVEVYDDLEEANLAHSLRIELDLMQNGALENVTNTHTGMNVLVSIVGSCTLLALVFITHLKRQLRVNKSSQKVPKDRVFSFDAESTGCSSEDKDVVSRKIVPFKSSQFEKLEYNACLSVIEEVEVEEDATVSLSVCGNDHDGYSI